MIMKTLCIKVLGGKLIALNAFNAKKNQWMGILNVMTQEKNINEKK